MNYLLNVPGLEAVLTNAEGCERFELAPDRVGDIIIVSEKRKVLGTTEARHDLSGLEVPLRSHGGTTEQRVPLIINRSVVNLASDRRLRNFDIYDLAFNHTEA